ncbi:S-locus glycoprotein domain [Dillenia turbinata]|uniref:Receptor-like serine/threonine-protein kinase n=1 Tax=Dillenia turbinata TaxID=194707 RepID=A0AAN8ZM83_9MAGN
MKSLMKPQKIRLAILLPVFFAVFTVSKADDTLFQDVVLKDGGNTIVSSGGVFELGFFSRGTSSNRYLGIWFKKISNGTTVVWVANRQNPIPDKNGTLKLISPGILVLVNGTNSTVWSSNTTTSVQNPVAQLFDYGNLVVRDANDEDPNNYLWQSFDYPTDSFLPRMKFGKNLVTGVDTYLSSWASPDDPSPGPYITRIDLNGFPQIFIRNVSSPIYRSGPWNGLRFSGMPNLKPNPIYNYTFVMNRQEVIYTYELLNDSVVTMMVLDQQGILQRYTWIDRTQKWELYLSVQIDNCDTYNLCGAYGSCNIVNSPACGCLDKFEPKFPNNWNDADWSGGCVRKTSMNCSSDAFQKYSGIKLPDTNVSRFNFSTSLDECQALCLKNCSCMAYTSANISNGGSGCLMWFGDLVDIRAYSENGQDIYIRLAASDVGGEGIGTARLVIILSSVFVFMAIILCLCIIWKCRKMKWQRKRPISRSSRYGQNWHDLETAEKSESHSKDDLELPLFDFVTIADATGNFASHNKLGEGGFGPVYMGKLEDGEEIAVKRLSKESKQGFDEFKNELNCIAKLQHRNLVKLLGCCMHEEEKMLVYEYMPNKSLDSFIFDKKQSKILDWPLRYQIINGTARGLLYLHQDSRLRIIHRDLKASNILLDMEMNPKISDFGLARIFGGNETAANTMRVVGTYGYMAPEYAVDGLFSVKSDVFSFGVLVLEIISGKRNRGFQHVDHRHNLVGHAWRLYKEDKALELIDESICTSYDPDEVLRSIHIGLLCVQQSPEDRPSMASVVVMLGSNYALPEPKVPGFYTERKLMEGDTSSSKISWSTNELTFTVLEAR